MTRDLEAENAQLRRIVDAARNVAFYPPTERGRANKAYVSWTLIDKLRAALSPPSASEQSAPPHDLEAENERLRTEIAQQREYWADQYSRWRHERAALSPPSASKPGAPMTTRDLEDENAVVAFKAATKAYCGFLYGNRHVIRDLRKPYSDQVVWSIEEKNADELGLGSDYERCHAEMTAETDRLIMSEALAAALSPPSASEQSAPVAGSPDAWRG